MLGILGDHVPDNMKPGAQALTIQQAVDDWIETSRERWNSRTVNHYQYQSKKFTEPYGVSMISSITTADIKKIDTSTISRGEQKHVQGIVWAVFKHVEEWLHTDPETFAKAVVVSGTKDDERAIHVLRWDYEHRACQCAHRNVLYNTESVRARQRPYRSRPHRSTTTQALHRR